jgi:hypothetical protein
MFISVLEWLFLGQCSLTVKLLKQSGCHWLRSIDENLRPLPKQLWKYVSIFRKEDTDLIQLDTNGILFTKPCDIADAFIKYFQPSFSAGTFCSLNQCMKFYLQLSSLTLMLQYAKNNCGC